MSGQVYTTLNARVKQKLATDAYWRSIENEIGVIFEGEQAFVYDENGTAVNFKIGDGTKLYSQLPFFIAYYSGALSQKVLSWVNTSTNISIPSTFRNNSLIQELVVYNNSGGDIALKIGTTNGGSEICQLTVPTGPVTIGKKYAFQDVETVYITGLTGKSCTIFLLYFQLDEAPAAPAASTGAFKFPKGYVGIYEPVAGQIASDVWDFATGLAKPGFGYDNCVLAGTNGTKSRGHKISYPFIAGDTVGNDLGANQIVITSPDQLPAFTVQTPIPRSRYATQAGGSDHPYGAATPNNGIDTLTSNSTGKSFPISFQALGIIDIWFVAVS